MNAKHLLILGGGTAGTMIAHHTRRHLAAKDWKITVLDRDENHYYQPGFLFYPFGHYTREQIVKKKRDFMPKGVDFKIAEVDKITPDTRSVSLKDGSTIEYDLLVIATGCRTAPEETEGMLGAEWRKSIFDFYTFDGAAALRDQLAVWEGGNLVVHVTEMPVKCPVAPLEFAFLAESFFRERGMRENVHITYVTPLTGAFTKPKAAKKLSHLLTDKGIKVETDFAVERIDGEAKKLICYDGREVPFDLLVTTPTNMGAEVIRDSGLGDDLDFVPTQKHTLQSLKYPDVFILGDATNVPTSKAGSVAHFEAEALSENLLRYIAGKPLLEDFDGHANCFIESGNGKALLIDFNYEIEPHEGGFPFAFGPMKLLEESRMNHLGKLAFRHVYWNILMRGRPLLGINRIKKAPATH
jgi:sulfide:quinone oxidoreductase